MNYLSLKETPYKYHGPLDPIKDKLVLVPRSDDLNSVIHGIQKDQYWGIFGPRQIGKSTFLRQIEHNLKQFHHIRIDLEASPQKNFYKWLAENFVKQVPIKPIRGLSKLWETEDPHIAFYKFLERFTPKEFRKKIIIYFDEVEGVPDIDEFLHNWRTVFHERIHQPELMKYSVIITGAGDFIQLPLGKNSPYNIAQFIYMRDFSKAESIQFIENTFGKLGIGISHLTIQNLNDFISGHPQMLQHACHILAQLALTEKRDIKEADIENVIHELFIENLSIDGLKSDLKNFPELNELIRNILNGIKPYYPKYKQYSIVGHGSIIEDEEKNCAIRNKIYERYLTIHFNEMKETPVLQASFPFFHNDSIGKVIDQSNRYEMFESIGEGGMGKVIRARDKVLDRIVALKLLNQNLFKTPEEIENFRKEARLAARLSHPNIVTIYDFGKINNNYFISMEYIEGTTLEKVLHPLVNFIPHFDLKEIVYFSTNLLKAIYYAHNRDIIHRDIKPKNIMVTSDGKFKIVDFGLAALRKNQSLLTIDGREGTPLYMSPEQIQVKPIDNRADIYSFGVTLYETITRKVPFDGKDREQVYLGHLVSPPPSILNQRSDIPEELEKIVMKCLEKEPNNRYQSAGDIIEDFKKLKIENPGETSIEKNLIRRINEIITPNNYEAEHE